MKTLPLTLPLVQHPLVLMPLYHHQAVMLDEWTNHSTFLVGTKTGTGKTAAAVLPILKYKESAIMVYPTNELIRNQVAGVVNIARLEGLNPCIYEPETTKEEFGKADVLLVHIDAAALEKWGREKGWGNKWKVLNRLLENNKTKIIFTNPDILFLIFALRYRGEVLASLQGYRTLVVDEFHLYQGVEFAHALFMVHLARHMGMFERVVLLSATPDPEVKKTVRRFFAPLEIDLSTRSRYVNKGKRKAVHEVEIILCSAGTDPVETAVNTILSLREREKLIELGKQENEPEYIPAVVVLNSVINAIRLEDRLVEEGFSRNELLIARGLSDRDIRQKRPEHLLVIGTSAIEVGVDFKCDYLVFEAFEAPSFMQRFGRVGRHRPGKAYIICPENVRSGIEGLDKEVTRDEFETKVYDWYATPESRPWFIYTRSGLITVYTLVNNIISKVMEGYQGSSENIDVVKNKLENIAEKYAEKIHCERLLAAIRSQFAKAGQGIKEYKWLKVYQELNTFRTSLPSIRIYDYAEKERRGEQYASYNVDLISLIHRAEGLSFNPKLNFQGPEGMLTVKRYGKYKQVSVIGISSISEAHGRFFQTVDFPELSILQNDHCTPVSHIMTLKNHIFTIVPKNLVKSDWRLPAFPCGQSLIAFDGAALLLNELYLKNMYNI
ncbi:DEAD/DEAH box helicase [Pelotomaculum sp. FP]|uniref:type I-D CRISPR-associated helicase Cas3' n=1 Tax=Pelotomaculum sp. FP TaxID=261474 RepID=UPI0010653BE9|nr:type I-D CRISPR-associated helicase Cas3' [Pelotomaculum sp. FP]TEB11494.1 DEAD/DEAH box helicase [Pelotomaculum sp. FP]